jgi:DNA-binding CsgD family transcriptional regulator
MRIVMRGDSLLSPAVTRRLIGKFVARPPDAVAATGMESLTGREREVVALVAHGLSNDEIAGALVLSPATAKTHVSRAMIKLGARDRAQLVVFAYQTGLVTPHAAGPVPGRYRYPAGLRARHSASNCSAIVTWPRSPASWRIAIVCRNVASASSHRPERCCAAPR